MVRHAVWESLVAVDIDHRPPAEDVSVRIGLGAVGPLRMCSARATAVTVHRTERQARTDEEPAVFLGLQVSGTSLVAQNSRQCVLTPGEFAVYESITPYTLLFDEGVDHHFLRFPARHSHSPTACYGTPPRSPWAPTIPSREWPSPTSPSWPSATPCTKALTRTPSYSPASNSSAPF
ncbi:hypothetical protein SHKM778_36230 [Streptomyces sp. KM77-8]|uniref:Transcription regulator HTH AraC- type ligand binding domain-containing protein n=1 Tax=Streptomyces haneummycinicus TaxID=3074435 RepID=A0AAT9HIN3_9ACTN